MCSVRHLKFTLFMTKNVEIMKMLQLLGDFIPQTPLPGLRPWTLLPSPRPLSISTLPQPLWAGDATGQKHGPFQSSSPWGGQHPSRNPLAASSVSSLTPSHFLPRDATRKRCLCCLPVSVRPSVRLSRLCIVSRRLKISSNLFIGPVAPSF